MKLNIINLILYVLAKHYAKSNSYDVAHFHARGILTTMLGVVLLCLFELIKSHLGIAIDDSWLFNSKIFVFLIFIPVFLIVFFFTKSSTHLETAKVEVNEEKYAWFVFWILFATTVFLILLAAYCKHMKQ